MKRFLIITASLCLVLQGLCAHPHVFASAKVEFEYEGQSCKGFWVDWSFDQMFSASIIQETDLNFDGRYSEQEIRGVHDYAFRNLVKYGYFIFIRAGDKRWNPSKVTRFTARIEGARLSYRFFVPLDAPPENGELYVAVFDSTFYCALQYAENPVTVRQTQEGGPLPRWDRAVNKAFPVYYNPQGAATDGTVYKTWKPGLQTAYPEEIHVAF